MKPRSAAQHALTWIEISQSALKHNIGMFQRILRSSTSSLMAVVKSNAYGHDMRIVAHIAQDAGVRWFGVASSQEALDLRKQGIWSRILVLSYISQIDHIPDSIRKKIALPVYNLAAARRISKIAQKLKTRAIVHVKIDTGTTRLGVRPEDSLKFIRSVHKLPYVELEGLYTHFADSENVNQSFTNAQIKSLGLILNHCKKHGIIIPICHAGCSASTILNQQSHFSMARIGISLYGLTSVSRTDGLIHRRYPWCSLIPVLSWKTTIIQVKSIPQNTCVGYGCDYRSKKRMRIAVLPVGYWDGVDRKFSHGGYVLIHGRIAKVLGRVCMNMMMVDVSHATSVKEGDPAVIIGVQSGKLVSADMMANQIQTINYEVVTRINPLLPRVIV